MTLLQHAQKFYDASKRVRRAHSGIKLAVTRLVVCFALLVPFRLLSFMPNRQQVSLMLTIYALAVALLVFVFRQMIEQRRFRFLATLMDVVAISLLIKLTGTVGISWFPLYIFPIMSVARYLGMKWSVGVAVMASACYAWASPPLSSPEVIGTLAIHVTMLTMVGFTAAKLARTRYREEDTFDEMLGTASSPIMTPSEFDAAVTRILHFAIRITKSDLSAIALADFEQPKILALTEAGETSGSDIEDVKALMAKHYRKAIEIRRAIPLTRSGLWASLFPHGWEKTRNWTGRLVPLGIGGRPFAVLGVFSRQMIHYRPDDIVKLSRMASAVAILQKNAEVSRLLANEADVIREQKDEIERLREQGEARLGTLYRIGDLLKNELGLPEVFKEIVGIVSKRLHSEEAALFLWDEHEQRILKEAVAGPDPATTQRLLGIEASYARGESLTGQVFATRLELRDNHITQAVSHVTTYELALPSHCIKHYLGVPLLIGEDILGVIRVLNRKSLTYGQEGNFSIADKGFDDADLELLRMTARLIAVAIRAAGFIEQKRYFENLVYQSPDPIIVLDENKKIKNFNRACTEIWKVEEKDVKGQSVEKFYLTSEHAREIGKALARDENHRLHDHPAWVRDFKGVIIPIRLSATEFRTKNGEFTGSIGVFRDARSEHRDRLKALVNMSRDASHDIKNDVRAITYYFDAMQRLSQTYPEVRPIYEAIRAAAEAALGKLQALLMAAAPPPARPGLVSIVAEVEAWLAVMQDRLEAAAVELNFKRPAHDAMLSADKEQLRHVFANLFGNSVDAIIDSGKEPHSGRIDVAVELTEETAILTWRDNGIGMQEHTAKDAFTPFYTTKKKGNGLGLSISKDIVKAHGGSIKIHSARGEGTCITITLPLIVTAAARTAAEPENVHV